MRLGNVHGQPGDEIEDVQLDRALTVGAVGIDAHRGVSAVIGDTRHHDGGSKHVSGDSGERYSDCGSEGRGFESRLPPFFIFDPWGINP